MGQVSLDPDQKVGQLDMPRHVEVFRGKLMTGAWQAVEKVRDSGVDDGKCIGDNGDANHGRSQPGSSQGEAHRRQQWARVGPVEQRHPKAGGWSGSTELATVKFPGWSAAATTMRIGQNLAREVASAGGDISGDDGDDGADEWIASRPKLVPNSGGWKTSKKCRPKSWQRLMSASVTLSLS